MESKGSPTINDRKKNLAEFIEYLYSNDAISVSVLEALQEQCSIYMDYAYEAGLLKGEKDGAWIDSKERLPEVRSVSKYDLFVFNCTLRNGAVVSLEWEQKTIRGKQVKRWKWIGGRICEYEVIAWRPLPQRWVPETEK